ncbi:creatinine amidohydrolase [Azospirillaceae bacterium]
MQIALSTWLEVEDYLRRSRGIIVPIGSTEQHGPTGLIGTDAICAEVIARRVGDLAQSMVGPTLPVGMAVHHMAFPGTITLRPSTLMLVIRDYVTSLARHGFQRVFFVNGHGGNAPSLRAAFYEIYAETMAEGETRVRCAMVNWWEAPEVQALLQELFGQEEGSHATPGEVSVTQCAYPDQVRDVVLTPQVAPTGGIHDPEDFRRRFPDGRIGSNPALASPEHGRRLTETAARAIAAQYLAFAAEI